MSYVASKNRDNLESSTFGIQLQRTESLCKTINLGQHTNYCAQRPTINNNNNNRSTSQRLDINKLNLSGNCGTFTSVTTQHHKLPSSAARDTKLQPLTHPLSSAPLRQVGGPTADKRVVVSRLPVIDWQCTKDSDHNRILPVKMIVGTGSIERRPWIPPGCVGHGKRGVADVPRRIAQHIKGRNSGGSYKNVQKRPSGVYISGNVNKCPPLKAPTSGRCALVMNNSRSTNKSEDTRCQQRAPFRRSTSVIEATADSLRESGSDSKTVSTNECLNVTSVGGERSNTSHRVRNVERKHIPSVKCQRRCDCKLLVDVHLVRASLESENYEEQKRSPMKVAATTSHQDGLSGRRWSTTGGNRVDSGTKLENRPLASSSLGRLAKREADAELRATAHFATDDVPGRLQVVITGCGLPPLQYCNNDASNRKVNTYDSTCLTTNNRSCISEVNDMTSMREMTSNECRTNEAVVVEFIVDLTLSTNTPETVIDIRRQQLASDDLLSSTSPQNRRKPVAAVRPLI